MSLGAIDKIIPVDQAVKVIWTQGRKQKISLEKLGKLEAYVSALPADENGCIRLDKLVGVLRNLQQAIALDDPSCLLQKRGYKVDRIPSVEEVVCSREFANQGRTIWPSTLENLQFIHEGTPDPLPYYCTRAKNDGSPPCIIALSGAAGTGKSETTWLSAFITLMDLGMLHDPHVELDHNPGSWIVLVLQGIKEEITRGSLFDRLKYAVDESPWFKENFPRRSDFNEELQWPEARIKVVCLTGQFRAGLSKDVLWAAITEINEMPVYTRSKQLKNVNKTELDVGDSMFNTLANRIETRFSELGGGFPGKLIADSARSYVGDFTDKLRVRAKTDPRILLIERKLWEAKSHKYPASEPRFLVELGDDFKPARMIESRERAINPDSVIEIPERHKQRCETDLEEALKDLAGIPTTAAGRFIPFPEAITRAQEAYVEMMGDLRPFKFQEISFRELFGDLKAGEAVDWSLLINYEYFEQILDKTVAFTMHADMSLTGDSSGFSFARVIGSKEIANALVYNKEAGHVQEVGNIEAPIYCVDGILRITARPGEIIDPNLTEALGLELKRLVNMRYGSADWFEAMSLILNWRRAGIIADKYSVDRRPDGCFEYKHALRDERILMMPHKINDRETRRVKKELKQGKVFAQHPDNESKDCFDSVSGCLGVLSVTEAANVYRVIEKPNELETFGTSAEEEYIQSPHRYSQGIVTRGGRGRRVY